MSKNKSADQGAGISPAGEAPNASPDASSTVAAPPESCGDCAGPFPSRDCLGCAKAPKTATVQGRAVDMSSGPGMHFSGLTYTLDGVQLQEGDEVLLRLPGQRAILVSIHNLYFQPTVRIRLGGFWEHVGVEGFEPDQGSTGPRAPYIEARLPAGADMEWPALSSGSLQ